MTEVSKKLLARRKQVAAAVKRWRERHREEYNAYSRRYLQRPGPHATHLERCRRYRAKKKLLAAVEDVVVDVGVPPMEINEEARRVFGSVF